MFVKYICTSRVRGGTYKTAEKVGFRFTLPKAGDPITFWSWNGDSFEAVVSSFGNDPKNTMLTIHVKPVYEFTDAASFNGWSPVTA